jgi:hypothetical protein
VLSVGISSSAFLMPSCWSDAGPPSLQVEDTHLFSATVAVMWYNTSNAATYITTVSHVRLPFDFILVAIRVVLFSYKNLLAFGHFSGSVSMSVSIEVQWLSNDVYDFSLFFAVVHPCCSTASRAHMLEVEPFL